MVIALIALGIVALVIGVAVGWWLPPHGRRGRASARQADARRILLPFSGEAISTRALDAAFRLAHAEGATLMPAYLATVPRSLPLDAALPGQVGQALPVMEAVEQRASRRGIPTDCRVSRGRSRRDALRRLVAEEQVDRIIVAARRNGDPGFSPEEIAWLLVSAPAEVVVLRPGPDDHRVVTAEAVRGHF
jgi:nucleotide-binding universal stress UspA family protein